MDRRVAFVIVIVIVIVIDVAGSGSRICVLFSLQTVIRAGRVIRNSEQRLVLPWIPS